MIRVLDLFSAAAGGWSLGMHRAGFTTMAACEFVAWRRALYSQNNPGVPVYDDVRTLTADRLIRDGHGLPDIVVGSPPCQDISSANTKGKGVEGERSGLYFEAIRIIGECRPRWFALENSSNLRTRGADAVLAALEALGYGCWPFVVRAGDIGANHERPRCWLIGCDVGQITNAGGRNQWEQSRWRDGADRSDQTFDCNHDPAKYDGHADGEPGATRLSIAPNERQDELSARRLQSIPKRRGNGSLHAPHASGKRSEGIAGREQQWQEEIAECSNSAARSEMGDGEDSGHNASEPWPHWNSGLASHLRLDDGLSAWLAGTRIAVGGPRGTSAASLIVEAFGDAVIPQIPEAIGRAILRTERALAEVYGRIAA